MAAPKLGLSQPEEAGEAQVYAQPRDFRLFE